MDALGNLVTVQEPDPTLGTVSTNYTYDILNHLIKVSMPRGANTQTRTFNYNVGTVVGIDLLSATNPENGTITYTYNSDHTLHTKGGLTYSYDGYKRLTQIMAGSTVLRTFMYDTYTGRNLLGIVHGRAPGSGATYCVHSTRVHTWDWGEQHQLSKLHAVD